MALLMPSVDATRRQRTGHDTPTAGQTRKQGRAVAKEAPHRRTATGSMWLQTARSEGPLRKARSVHQTAAKKSCLKGLSGEKEVLVVKKDERQARYLQQRNAKLKTDPEFASAFRAKEKTRRQRWREAHPERVSAINALAYANNKESIRKARRERPEVRRANDAARRARKLGAEGSHNSADVLLILSLQKWRCAACAADLRNGHQVDHIEPLARGGSDDRKNLQALYKPCNLRKGAKDPYVFANQIGRLL